MEESVLVVRARSIALETGRVQVDVTERGPLPDLFAIFERIARRIAPSSTSPADIERQHPPVAVFEDYIKGLLAETPATAINYLNSALKRQPSFDRARLALWEVFAEQSDHEQALAAVALVPAGSPWARRAHFLAGVSQLHLKKYDEAFATFKALADAQPTPTVLNNLGVVQLRRGATPQTGLPTYYFTKAAEADPGRRGLRVQPRVRLLGGSRSAGGGLLAARSRSPQAGRRRRALRARRGARRRREPRRIDARTRAGAPAVVDVRRHGPASRRRGGAQGSRAREKRSRAAARPARDGARGQRAARSGGARDVLISIAAGDCSSRKTIATRSSS